MVMFFTLLLMGVGLAMDAFAVSICKGLSMRKVNKKQCLVIGLFFGGFQALMPFIGWVLGSQFEQYITSIDHSHLHFCRCQSLRQFPSSGLRPL